MPSRKPTLLEHWKVKSMSRNDWSGLQKQQTATRPGLNSEQHDVSSTCAEHVPNVKVRETQCIGPVPTTSSHSGTHD